MNLIRVLPALALAALALLPATTSAATNERVSVSSAEVEALAGQSVRPAISADGRFVAFGSEANNLVAGDTNGLGDVFVRDRTLGTTERVSVDSAEVQSTGGASFNTAISADGRFVAFGSTANNLAGAGIDTNGFTDVFVRDRSLGTTERVSVDSAEAQATGGTSTDPAISADGHFVAFQSQATNLVTPDANGIVTDVFVRNRLSGTTERVSVSSAEVQPASDPSRAPAISADGRFVAFESGASALVSGDSNNRDDIFVRDRSFGTTERVSVNSDEQEVTSILPTTGAAISADGRYVAFYSDAPGLVSGDTNGSFDVFVRDRLLGTTERASVDNAGAQGNSYSRSPAISGDGRFVAFDSDASNLVPGDTNGNEDVFVRDRVAGYAVRASLAGDGTEALGGSSSIPAITTAGLVAFESGAINLVASDNNFLRDIFVRSADTDGDKILEPHDNCPSNANADQTDSDADGLGNTCDPDDDNDALGDLSDSCPLLGEDFDGFEDADGCPDPDNDLDGVCDTAPVPACTGLDIGQHCFDPAGTLSCPTRDCRNIAEDIDGFKDTDGCPEPDNDNDGFPDATDDCPGTDSLAGPDGMLGSPQDLNHNGIKDPSESPLSTDDSALTFEDYDTVLNGDGCHDSPGQDFDADGYTDDTEEGSLLCNGQQNDLFEDNVVDDGCPGGPAQVGAFSEAQFRTGTKAFDPCGQDAWPSDLVSTGISANRFDIVDLGSFVAPVRRMDKNPGHVSFDPRWDLAPGNGGFGAFINVGDLAATISGSKGFPPMFGGQRALNQTCPSAP